MAFNPPQNECQDYRDAYYEGFEAAKTGLSLDDYCGPTDDDRCFWWEAGWIDFFAKPDKILITDIRQGGEPIAIKEYLKKNLEIRADTDSHEYSDGGGHYTSVKIRIILDGEEIDSDTFSIHS